MESIALLASDPGRGCRQSRQQAVSWLGLGKRSYKLVGTVRLEAKDVEHRCLQQAFRFFICLFVLILFFLISFPLPHILTKVFPHDKDSSLLLYSSKYTGAEVVIGLH
jgi:hypothetical protein